MDTIGTSKFVLLVEVSFFEGSFNIIIKLDDPLLEVPLYMYYWKPQQSLCMCMLLLWKNVSSLYWCTLFLDALYVNCTCNYVSWYIHVVRMCLVYPGVYNRLTAPWILCIIMVIIMYVNCLHLQYMNVV